MIKSKRIDFFFGERKVCDKDEKNASTLTKLKKFHEHKKFKIMKRKSLKFIELHIMNLKIY